MLCIYYKKGNGNGYNADALISTNKVCIMESQNATTC